MIDRYSLPKMKAIFDAQNKFQTWLDIELAACEAYVKLGNISRADFNTIKNKAKFSIKRIDEIEKTTNHDVIAFLTNVAENVGPASRFVHLGLTSSDVVDTALSLIMKEAIQILEEDVLVFMKVLKKRALQTKNMVMIGRTHGIHAEPMTFGLKLVLWYEEMKRNLKRLAEARENIAVGKISGAVGTYANISPKVEAFVCKKLGLEPSPISTQVLQRDRHAQFMTTIAIVAGSLEKFATEIRNLQRTDLTEAAEPFGKGQKGSSAMPHKRNPITCERVAGLARVIRGYSVTAMENMALWHERDITHSSAERIIVGDACILLDYMLQIFTKVVEGLEVYPENMRANLYKYGGIVFSQRLLLTLINKGMTREDAYKLVQRNALRARDENGSFKDNVLGDEKIMTKVKPEEIAKIFEVKYHLKNIDLIFKRVFKK
ncbi:MAG: adenylosuccinate lyase [Candidatus Margulisbacteria bacterium]|nr:adenylosuccinate lyase [Candidatus Margulisiibacteriota bacterium]